MRIRSLRSQIQVLMYGLLVFLLAASQGCVNDPNPVGAGLLPRSDFLRIDTTTIIADGSYSQEAIPPPATNRILIGKSGEVEAWGLLRFLPLPDSLKNVNVVGAHVELRALYHFGDSLAAFSFSAHRILQDWKGDSLTIDSLNAPGFYQTSPIGSLTAGSVGDTATISVSLDTSVVRSWLSTSGDTVSTNEGVLFRPTNSRVVKGFATFSSTDGSFRPKLTVLYNRTGTTQVDTARINLGIARFVATSSKSVPTSDSLRMYVHNGLATRAVIKFSVASLPPRSAIHRAVLEVRLDNSLSQLNYYTADSLQAYFIDKEGIVLGSWTASERRLDGAATVYRFQIGLFVQRWVRDPEFTSVAIGGFDESDAVDVFVLHGSAAATSLKPRITIVYSPVQ